MDSIKVEFSTILIVCQKVGNNYTYYARRTLLPVPPFLQLGITLNREHYPVDISYMYINDENEVICELEAIYYVAETYFSNTGWICLGDMRPGKIPPLPEASQLVMADNWKDP